MAVLKGRHADFTMKPSDFDSDEDEKILHELFRAYFDARRNKRNTLSALAFERRFEPEIFSMFDELREGRYEPKPSICFVVERPVKREIFAADFRDRVIHHFIYNHLSPVFEKIFINDSYSCREGRGVHYGVSRLDHFMRSCSENYSRECYVMKADIRGYFMSIDRHLLFSKISDMMPSVPAPTARYRKLLLCLVEKTIFNDPTRNCIMRGDSSDWRGLPSDKTLFCARKDCGLPIGNLTSQLFGNIYLNDLDHFIKRDLGVRYYGRYVDDIVMVHRECGHLKSALAEIVKYLKGHLMLDLHTGKTYLQTVSKGVRYLGAVIKPHRIYISKRTKGNFYESIRRYNRIAEDHPPGESECAAFLSSMNSYLGIMKHYKTYKIRKQMIGRNLSKAWWKVACLNGKGEKFVLTGRKRVGRRQRRSIN